MRSQTQEAATAPGGEPAGEASAPSPPDPPQPPGNGAAAGPFARTKQAVEAERLDAEGGRAWSHVLRTPEEIGATQGSSSLGRLLRRLFRFSTAAQPAAGAQSVGGAIGIGTSRPAGFARRRSRTSPGAVRSSVTFVLALGTSALVTSLLFAGLLGLPGDVPTPRWASWPFGATNPSGAPAAKGEVVVAGLPEAEGQGGPEIALGSPADGAKVADDAADVAARPAGSQPAMSGVVVVAGSAQDAWRQYYLLGHRLHAEGDLHGAVEMYREAASLAPGDANTFYDWARALQMLGDRDAAIEKYRAALDLAPESRTGADARARLSELRPH